MSILYSQRFRRVLQEQRASLREFGARLISIAHGDDFEMLMREIRLRRAQIADSIKNHATGIGHLELIELQSRLNSELDELVPPAIERFIEERTRSLTEEAQRDSLTRLYNRAAFDRRLCEEVERARRYRRELSLVLLDIDRFKTVNDQFGHQAGDRFLIQVASILQSSLRQSDAAFRYGGDEFAALCPETPGVAVVSVLRRIESGLKKYCLEARFNSRIGISWGIASFPVDATDISVLISLADSRLYNCKNDHHRSFAAIA